jgi:DNA-binding response OmpR family regulator
MKILIVEDEIIPANYLKKLLEVEGYKVLENVEKGADAIRIAKQKNPDIILMDVMLEDNISGCDAALEISKHNSNILIVFLTAYSDKEMINFAIASKAFGYLLKPYRDKEILATLSLAEAHLKNRLIKTEEEKESTIVTLRGNYTFHTDRHALHYHSEKVNLGPQALNLISLLCKHKHRTLHSEMILNTLWETPMSAQALRSLVYRIRESTIPEIILNSSKTGYQIGLKM